MWNESVCHTNVLEQECVCECMSVIWHCLTICRFSKSQLFVLLDFYPFAERAWGHRWSYGYKVWGIRMQWTIPLSSSWLLSPPLFCKGRWPDSLERSPSPGDLQALSHPLNKFNHLVPKVHHLEGDSSETEPCRMPHQALTWSQLSFSKSCRLIVPAWPLYRQRNVPEGIKVTAMLPEPLFPSYLFLSLFPEAFSLPKLDPLTLCLPPSLSPHLN